MLVLVAIAAKSKATKYVIENATIISTEAAVAVTYVIWLDGKSPDPWSDIGPGPSATGEGRPAVQVRVHRRTKSSPHCGEAAPPETARSVVQADRLHFRIGVQPVDAKIPPDS